MNLLIYINTKGGVTFSVLQTNEAKPRFVVTKTANGRTDYVTESYSRRYAIEFCSNQL